MILFALAALAFAALTSYWSERGALREEASLRAASRRNSSLAFALFQRRTEPAPGRVTGFAGRVIDARGAPIAAAQVCASCANCEASHAPSSACARSDARGAYAISRLTAGGYYLSAVARDHLPMTAFEGEAAFLQPNELRGGVDLVLQSGGARLVGHVLDATGGPIALAKVRALRLVPPRLSVDVITDENGRFELALLPGPLQIIADAEGYAPGSKNVSAPHRDVTLLLTPESTLRGTVVSAGEGRAIEGVEVRALPAQSPGVAIFRTAVSGADGAFTLRGLEPDTYLLVAKGERWQEREVLGVELGVASQVDDVRVELEPAAALSGRVRTSEGDVPCREGYVALSPPQQAESEARHNQAPLASAVRGVGRHALIQADGSVFFPGVAPGSYAVEVRCIGYSLADGPRALQVGKDAIDDLDWKVIAAPNLTVTVTDRGGRPVSGVGIDLGVLAPDGRPRGFMSQLAGPDGRAKFPGLEAGRYTLAARGGPTVPVELAPHERDKKVTLVLPPGGMITLSVVTAEQTPVDGATISVLKLADDAATLAATPVGANITAQGEGVHQIGPLPAGRYVVRVTDEANPPVEVGREGARLALADGVTARAHVVLRRGGKIEGQVVDEQGGPVANVWVHALSEAQRSRMEEINLMVAPARVLTDLQGGFTFLNLAEDARYLLRAEEPAGAVAQKAGVRPGEPVTLTVPSSAAISGEVVAANGEPLQRYTLRATHLETGAARMASIADASGRFSLSGITPGTVEIAVTGDSGAFVQSTVQLIPGKRLNGLRLAESQAKAPAAPASDPSVSAEAARGNGT